MAARASATWWSSIARLETTVVRTEAEALLLENNLIKALNPRFNILFRDDKSYPYLKLGESATTVSPRVAYYRGAVDKQAPLLRPLPERLGGQGDDPADPEGVPPAHLRGHRVRQPHAALPAVPDPRCSGPCVGLVPPEDYARDVANTERFLRGDTPGRAGRAAAAHVRARAEARVRAGGRVRNQMGALSRVLHQQSVDENSRRSRQGRRHPRGAGPGRARLRQPGDGARRAPPGRPRRISRRMSRRRRPGRRALRRAGGDCRPARCRCSRPSSPSTTSTCACRRCWSRASRRRAC